MQQVCYAFIFKNNSQAEVTYLQIRFDKTFLQNKNNTDRNGLNEQDTQTHRHRHTNTHTHTHMHMRACMRVHTHTHTDRKATSDKVSKDENT